jgi:hypothetical protein
MAKTVRLAIISDLHFRADLNGAYRPAAGSQGASFDPIAGLLDFLRKDGDALKGTDGSIADYLVCPGDICDRANAQAFNVGWEKLKEIQTVLGAAHMVAATGNHEVISRTEVTDGGVQPESAIDPLCHLQKLREYPTCLLRTEAERWTYWGRGYEIIEEESILILLVNSSHFHFTMAPGEYLRGRIGEVALKLLRDELKNRVDQDRDRIFLVLMHHHPISHVDLDVELGRTEMYNGAHLMQILSECGVAWLVIHGHKHHPKLRFGSDDGPGKSIIFAAGSGGAELTGELAARTRLQFYIVEADVTTQALDAQAAGRIRSFSWVDNRWQHCLRKDHGLPDRCGFSIPECDVAGAAKKVATVLCQSSYAYLTWEEVMESVPELSMLLPGKIEVLRRALSAEGVNATWPESNHFPTDLSYDRK